MKINLLLFAVARDLAGTPSVDLVLPENSTLGCLKRSLVEQCPQLSEIVQRSAFSIDQEYAHDHQTVPADAEVGMIPPVSGG